MDRRFLLDNELREVLQETLGYVNIYFQPPESVRMNYDCIRYRKVGMDIRYGDNRSYMIRDQYEVMVITRDPDSPLPRIIQERFAYCSPGREFEADNLYHHPFTIYY